MRAFLRTNLISALPAERISPTRLWSFLGIVFPYLFLVHWMSQELSNADVLFLLYPVQQLIHWFTGMSFTWMPEFGYVHNEGLVRINQSCSGFIFLNVLLLLAFKTLFLNGKQLPIGRKITFALAVAPLAYLTCTLVNTSRVLLGIQTRRFALENSWFPGSFAHELFGIFYLLLFAGAFYFLLQKTVQAWKR